MLGNLLRQLTGNVAPVPRDAREMEELAAFLRSRVHPLLRDGQVGDALVALSPRLAEGAPTRAARNLVEFSIRGIAGLAQTLEWRADLGYLLGTVLLSLDDSEGAELCASIAWEEPASRFRRFERGASIVDYARAAGSPTLMLPQLDVARMDGRPAPLPAMPHSFVCALDGGQVIGESFLPVSAEGIVFTERCTDAPVKLERFDGLQWLDMLRMASETALWAAEGPVDDYAGEHVLLGNHENIGHWLLYFFSRLRVLEAAAGPAGGALERAKVVVGESVKPLHLDCLARAGIDASRIVRIPKGRYARFERLWVPSMPCGVSGNEVIYWAPGTIADIRRRLGVTAPRGGGKRRVFLSRRGARWRRLANEDAIAAVLAKRGFEEVDAGKLTLAEQVALGAEVGAMVGCFGAGMNLQLFLGEGVPIVQLQIEQRVRMNIHVPIAGELDQPFHPVVGEVTTRHADPLKSDFAVKPARILEALDRAGIR